MRGWCDAIGSAACAGCAPWRSCHFQRGLACACVAYNFAAAPTATLDFGLYQTFWRLQSYTIAPSRAIESDDAWKQFLAGVDVVLAALESQTDSGVHAVAGAAADDSKGEEGEEVPDGGSGSGSTAAVPVTPAKVVSLAERKRLAEAEDFYCTKYLTNSSLFNLEVWPGSGAAVCITPTPSLFPLSPHTNTDTNTHTNTHTHSLVWCGR